MSKKLIIGLVILGLFLFMGLGFFGCGASINNAMVGKQEGVDAQWANVQNAYQRRSDLIPNLVATVKGYATHEESTLNSVIEARAKATQIQLSPDQLTPENLQKYQEAQGQLSAALGRLLMVKEQYPELKANTNFLQLQDELAGTENRISTERRVFNEKVQSYNSYIRSFPNSIIANRKGFEKRAYFEADQSAQSAPKVEF